MRLQPNRLSALISALHMQVDLDQTLGCGAGMTSDFHGE
jgi:hypothetical protein